MSPRCCATRVLRTTGRPAAAVADDAAKTKLTTAVTATAPPWIVPTAVAGIPQGVELTHYSEDNTNWLALTDITVLGSINADGGNALYLRYGRIPSGSGSPRRTCAPAAAIAGKSVFGVFRPPG